MGTRKDKRCFTVMIVPHTEESTFSLRIPLYALQLFVGLVVVAVIGVSVLGYAYFKAAAEARDSEHLRQINRAQQEEINALAVETERMMDQLKQIDRLVDTVTDKLEIEPEEFEDSVLGQSFDRNSSAPVQYNSFERSYYSSDRLYSSRSGSSDLIERATENLTLIDILLPQQTNTLDSVDAYVDMMEAEPSIWPCRGRISSGFGVRSIPYTNGYQFHNGVDVIGSYNTEIYATASGEVVFTGYRGSFGNLIVIDHGYDYSTHYAHLAGFAVTAGDLVTKGQIIGYMGASGRTTGTHLHYEVHYKGTPVNPANYMNQQ